MIDPWDSSRVLAADRRVGPWRQYDPATGALVDRDGEYWTVIDRDTGEPVVDERPVDHEDGRLAHYCRKDEILKATVDGVPIQALCGKVWVPDRDPSRYPVCATCEHILGKIKTAGSN